MLRTADLHYDLPPDLIATAPAEPRDSARMLVVGRGDAGRIDFRRVRDLPELLRSGDCLVFNTSRVLPARLIGKKLDTGGVVEGLYLCDAAGAPGANEVRWVALLDGKRLRYGTRVAFADRRGRAMVRATLIARSDDEPGAWIVAVEPEVGLGRPSTADILDRVGVTPLPPYILRARRLAGIEGDDATDRVRYQAVYADAAGSVAAPTAGLHFTPELLGSLAAAGVARADVTLHVGVGTFRPVSTEIVEEHPIHSEWCSMSAAAADAIRRTRERGGRVICVGTTACRTVESYAALAERGEPTPASLSTRLLITPGYDWRWTDGLLTNFHLPRSTLMALVAALLHGGVTRLRTIYAVAAAQRCRFYSFGDAMLVLP
ncbi:MAG: tRNA preQ1(34) S-adenosylmethionine ribosyltransferase-isomerase QueA [Phycisphaerales bacterium]